MYNNSPFQTSKSLKKEFKIPSSTKSLVPSNPASIQRSKSLTEGAVKSKGTGRDSGVGLDEEVEIIDTIVWNVQWREPQMKKNKTWENDGYLVVRGDKVTLRNESHKTIGIGFLRVVAESGVEIKVNGKDVLFDNPMTWSKYQEECQNDSNPFNSPATILQRPVPSFRTPSTTIINKSKAKAFIPLKSTMDHSINRSTTPSISKSKKPVEKVILREDEEEDEIENSPPKKKRKSDSATRVELEDDSIVLPPVRTKSFKSKSIKDVRSVASKTPIFKNGQRAEVVIDEAEDEVMEDLEIPSPAQLPKNLAKTSHGGTSPIIPIGREGDESDEEEGEAGMEMEIEEEDVFGDESIQKDTVKDVVKVDLKGKGKEILPKEIMKKTFTLIEPRPIVEVIIAARYYTCMYKNRSSKKDVWDGDGVLILVGKRATLKNVENGRDLGSAVIKSDKLNDNDQIWIGNREVQIESKLDKSLYESGEIFGNAPKPKPITTSFTLPGITTDQSLDQTITSSTFYTNKSSTFKDPLLFRTKPKVIKIGNPKHDPKAPGAIVMKRPDAAHGKRWNRANLGVVDVVLDPCLGAKLRAHQIDGVKFMYECVMGMRGEGQGCILADEMGLGKTIQAITLIWTLLQQNPYGGSQGVIQRAAIICPVTLLKNWSQEIQKWLPGKTTGVFVADQKANINSFVVSKTYKILIIGYEKLSNVIDALKSAQPPIGLVICDEGHRLKSAKTKLAQSIRQFRSVKRIILSGTPIQNDLGEFHAMVDFVNPGTLDTYATFKKVFESAIVKSREPRATKENKEVGFKRSEQLSRIAKTFVLRRTGDIIARYLPPKLEYVVFIVPTQLQLELYDMITGGSTASDIVGGLSGALCLPLMDILRKLCNTPGLLKKMIKENKGMDILSPSIVKKLEEIKDQNDFTYSGKLLALGSLLKELYKAKVEEREKIIVVSNFTATLDIIEQHCKQNRYPYCRLDGKTKSEDRMPMVGNFNTGPVTKNFIFLLSSKSGGTGLNLIGASRLVLFDSDWNPSIDLQAMARIHREGQKKQCVIYRFLAAGTLDEKIFQRQITKLGLSDSLMDDNDAAVGEAGGSKAKSNAFTPDELRSVFQLHRGVACQTHELLDCNCHLSDEEQAAMAISRPEGEDMDDEFESSSPDGFVSATAYQSDLPKLPSKDRKKLILLKEWKHHNCTDDDKVDEIKDGVLSEIAYTRYADAPNEEGNITKDGKVLRGGHISFAFSKQSSGEVK